MTEEERRMIAELSRQPGWALLQKVAANAKDREFNRLTNELLQGKRPTMAEVSFVRGFFKGLKHLLDNPTLEERSLERARKDVK